MIALYPREFLRAAFEFLSHVHRHGFVHADMGNLENTMLHPSSSDQITSDDFVFIDYGFVSKIRSWISIDALHVPWQLIEYHDVLAVPGLDICATCSALFEVLCLFGREKEDLEVYEFIQAILSRRSSHLDLGNLLQEFPFLQKKK